MEGIFLTKKCKIESRWVLEKGKGKDGGDLYLGSLWGATYIFSSCNGCNTLSFHRIAILPLSSNGVFPLLSSIKI